MMSTHIESNLKLIKSILAQVVCDKPGRMKLPPERTLAERLDVQRAKVREALSTLEELGFIQRVQGSGTFLEVPKPLFAQLYFDVAIQLDYISQESIESAREILERVIVQEATANATDDEVRELWRLCNVMIDSGDIETAIEADHDFHLLLAAMTRNPVIVMLFQCLSSALRQVLHNRIMLHGPHQSLAGIHRNHIAIVEAIEKRDSELAQKAMMDHFSKYKIATLMIGRTS